VSVAIAKRTAATAVNSTTPYRQQTCTTCDTQPTNKHNPTHDTTRQTLTVGGEPVRILKIGVLDLLEERHHGVLIKGQVPGQEYVQDDTDAPHVRCGEQDMG
jgi:hypothetical protein